MATNPLKVGRKVNVVSAHGGREYTGRISAVYDSGSRGAWYTVETGDKKNPAPKSFRAGELTPV